MPTKRRPILIMAGGTGGHVYPGLAVAEQLRCLDETLPLVWLGTERGLEARLVPQAGIELEKIEVAGLRGSGLRRWAAAPLMLSRAARQALAVLRRARPQLVLGMGGFVSGPGGIAARGLRIPLLIHEQNAIPGTTNRWLARVADVVLEAFPGSFPAARRAQAVGNPVRSAIAALPPPEARLKQRWQANNKPAEPARLLVLGGSQGALALNQLLPEALSRLPAERRPRVWHQTGERGYDSTINAYQEKNKQEAGAFEGGEFTMSIDANIVAFIDDMAQAYGWADLVIARSGALTVTELAAAGVGALLIPFPYAIDDHQSANAAFLARHGAAEVLPQSTLTADGLAARLAALLSDRSRLLAMAEAARSLAVRDAAERVAKLCLTHMLDGHKDSESAGKQALGRHES